VIQCLSPSAVTSLGSPAELILGLGKGALGALTSECNKSGATGQPAAPFAFGRLVIAGLVPGTTKEMLAAFRPGFQNPNKFTLDGRGPRRVSAIRSPPLQAELPE
jgi:hypothetical protein